MFKEAYIRDNNRIKPDEDFLARLKEAVSQEEETVVHIQEYTVLSENGNAGKKTTCNDRRIRNIFVVAACFVCVFAVVFWVNERGLLGNGENLKADLEWIFNHNKSDNLFEKRTDNEPVISEEYQNRYERMYRLFQKSNVSIYNIEDIELTEKVLEDVQELTGKSTALSHEERDELVGSILSERYTLTDSKGEFESAEYYIAVFEDGSYVCFVIEAGEYIYIEMISDIQSLANIPFCDIIASV